VCWRLESVIRVLPPVPGYFPVMRIFPGLRDRKYPVTSLEMRGLDVRKRLIEKRYLP